MKRSNQVNVLFVAAISAIAHGALSIVFVPFFSTLLLSLSASATHSAATETGMLLAVITPLAYMGIGFAFGALMAFGYNMFVWALLPNVKKTEVALEDEIMAQAAVGDAA
ncbi:MAG TPA: hypothetical protein VI636_15605 [Candidatus Angelobacter sp.]